MPQEMTSEGAVITGCTLASQSYSGCPRAAMFALLAKWR